MGELEKKILKDCDKKPLTWWRYIDDIFMLWQHGEKELERFLEFLNCCHPTIKYTADYSREEILYIIYILYNRDILYIKPKDTHQYLRASSCHVYHSKKSLPYSQALRLNRICL